MRWAMRITGVQVRAVTATRVYPTATSSARVEAGRVIGHDRSDCLLVELATDEGLIGLGEVRDFGPDMALPDGHPLGGATLRAYLERLLVGSNPFAIEQVLARLPARSWVEQARA